MRLGRGIFGACTVLLALGVGGTALAVSVDDGRIGPDLGVLNSGRALTPAGRQVALGNFPTGGAVTPDGRFYWTVSAGRGRNDVRIVDVAAGKVIQQLPLPGASGGIAIDPHGGKAYVSGIADSDDGHADQQLKGAPGREGDVIHVFTYDTSSGQAQEVDPISVPPPSSAPIPQNFPPTDTKKIAWPDRLAVSPDGGRLLVPLNLADAAAVVDVGSRQVRYVNVGHYPYGAAILPDGKTGLVSNETDGSVSVIDLESASKVKDIQVGTHLSHPEAIAVDPTADRAYVAIANSDQVAVIDTKALTLERTLSVERPEGQGSSPVALTVAPEGPYLVVADAGADELAVFKLPGLTLAGRIPTADYPTDVQAVPGGKVACEGGSPPARKPRAKRHRRKHRRHRHHHKRAHSARKKHKHKHKKRKPKKAAPATHTCPKLLWTAAKGVGTGPNPNGPNPYKITDANANSFQYLPTIVFGRAGILDVPTQAQLANYTRQADAQVRPSNPEPAPKDTPLKPNGPIKHVFYIVRENRTYDQVLGDVSKGDGDPNLAIFGKQVTPNMHALVDRFGLPDHVYANSEASIDGHFWTSAAKVSDYVNKNWHANYGARGRPYDFGVYSVTWPQNGFLFDQAEREGISYHNYGEAIAGVVPLTDKDRTPDESAQVAAKLAKSDLGPPQGCYPNDASINTDAITQAPVWDSTPPASVLGAESRFDCFRSTFNAQVASGSVPAFNYLVLSNDHTVGSSPGERTPRALVADNDYGLGQIVDLISHSSIWKESAIFVIEDDSQDGPDHVDAHRIPAAVISPYAKRGAVVHTRYDFLSVIRSMELILGMRPLGLFDALATPMYDSFTATPDNAEPFSAVAPTWDLLEKNTASSPNAALSHGLNFRSIDRVPQRTLDRILWQSVHGAHSAPPPPGPNAERETETESPR